MKKEEKIGLFVLVVVLVVAIVSLFLMFSQKNVSGDAVRSWRVSNYVAEPGGNTVAPFRKGQLPQPWEYQNRLEKEAKQGAESERLIGRYHNTELE